MINLLEKKELAVKNYYPCFRSVGRKNSNKKNHLNAYYTGVDLFPDSSEGEDELEENESSISSS